MSRIESSGGLRQREPRVRDKAHMGRVAQLPCVACLCRRGVLVRPVHVAHIRFGIAEAGWRSTGAAEKPSDRRCAPLCPPCHMQDQHGGSERAFWQRLGVYPPAFCAALVEAFASGQDGRAVLREAASGRFAWPAVDEYPGFCG